jgi:hypothetical protein
LLAEAYRQWAGRLQSNINAADGLNRAADVIEATFGTGWKTASSEVGRHARVGLDGPQDWR